MLYIPINKIVHIDVQNGHNEMNLWIIHQLVLTTWNFYYSFIYLISVLIFSGFGRAGAAASSIGISCTAPNIVISLSHYRGFKNVKNLSNQYI